MAGLITHIEIARRLYDEISDESLDYNEFLIGSIAPDTIKGKPGYVREDMKVTHLREGIKDINLLKDEYSSVFFKNADSFIDTYLSSPNSFYLGFLIHDLTDYLTHKLVRRPVIKIVQDKGILETDKMFVRVMTDEVHYLDHLLLKSSDIEDTVISVCNSVIPVNDFVDNEVYTISTHWVQDTLIDLVKKADKSILSENSLIGFVDEAVEWIVEYLRQKNIV